MTKVEVKIVSRETIKPSSPTPSHLKKFNLSMHDQFIPSHLYVSLLIFYPSLNHQERLHDSKNDIKRVLKSSLADTLVRFYPLAGSVTNTRASEHFIDCTDEGVEFIEAEVSGGLSDVLEHPDLDLLSGFMPINFAPLQEHRLLLVQANFFDSGGMAIGVSVSHRLADASSLGLLVEGWAAVARGDRDRVVPDMTSIASRFPAIPIPTVVKDASPSPEVFLQNVKTARYVFDAKSIEALKKKATSSSIHRPSSVEVVSSHIWMSMTRLSSGHTIRPSSLFQAVNLRKRINPALPEASFGNLVGIVRSQVENGEQVSSRVLVDKMRRGLEHVTANRGFLAVDEACNVTLSLVARGELDLYTISSWCKFNLYENVDFGFGRPAWMSPGVTQTGNFVVLMDGRGGDGIEAWLNLDEHEMEFLQANKNFHEFACFNPSVMRR